MFEDFPEELEEICDEYSISEEELSQFMEAIENKLNESDIKSEMLDADIKMSLLRFAVENYYSHPEYQQLIPQEEPNLEKSVNIAFTKIFPDYSYNDDLEIPKRR